MPEPERQGEPSPDARGTAYSWLVSQGVEATSRHVGLARLLDAAREQGRRDGLEEAARLVANAAGRYPADVFDEPLPGEHGRTVDACSARALRVVLPRLAAEILAIAPPAEKEPKPEPIRYSWFAGKADLDLLKKLDEIVKQNESAGFKPPTPREHGPGCSCADCGYGF